MSKIFIAGLAAVAVAALILIFNPGWASAPLTLKPAMAQAAATTIAALATVALILERALAVLNDLIFVQEDTAIRQRLTVARLTVPLAPPPVAPGMAPAALAAQAAAVQAHADARAAIAPTITDAVALDKRREQMRLVLGFIASFLISAAGVRTLATLVTDAHLSPLATGVDIMLTAGLLAGGSNALAKLVQLILEGANQKLTNLRTTP